MIREEAKLEFFTLLESGIIDFKEKNIIDKIYDDFENRSCENCNYFTSSPNTNKYDCCEKGISDCSISFCCNKWDQK